METFPEHSNIPLPKNNGSSPPEKVATKYRVEKRKGGEFSIESLLLSKNSGESSEGEEVGGCYQPQPQPPPTTQSLKARAPKHGLDPSNQSTTTQLHHGKRARTIFTTEQLERMEREFHKQQYVVGHERMYLANALNLTEAQVKVWFQNRRIKWRKQHMLSEQTKLNTLTDDPARRPFALQHDPQDQLDQLN